MKLQQWSSPVITGTVASMILASNAFLASSNLPESPIVTYSVSNFSAPTISVNDALLKNIDKIEKIARLQDNWNGYGAKHFSKELIEKLKRIVLTLSVQPEIFPTANGTIQLEYERNSDYLEFQIGNDEIIEVYQEKSGKEFESTIKASDDAINKLTVDFYG